MKTGFIAIVCLVWVGLFLGVFAVENRPESLIIEHCMYPGEILRDIARIYECPISVLMTINEIDDPDFSRFGAKIFVSKEVVEVPNLAEVREKEREKDEIEKERLRKREMDRKLDGIMTQATSLSEIWNNVVKTFPDPKPAKPDSMPVIFRTPQEQFRAYREQLQSTSSDWLYSTSVRCVCWQGQGWTEMADGLEALEPLQ